MNRMRVAALTAGICTLAVSAAAQHIRAMPPGPYPIPVWVGTCPIDFNKIDESTLMYTLVAYGRSGRRRS